MFILSAGMAKSGSTLFSFYQKEIIEHGFPENGQARFEQAVEDGQLNGVGHFVHDIDSADTLQTLYSLGTEFGPFVVKTHAPLTSDIKKFLKEHQVPVTFIHRDPRDVIISAIDHGKRIKKENVSNVYFTQFQTVENSIPLVRDFCRAGIDWISSGLCEVFTYHNLVSNPEEEIERFCHMISGTADNQFIRGLIEKYTVSQVPGVRQFNRGKTTRFREEMTVEEMEACNTGLSEEIVKLGYTI